MQRYVIHGSSEQEQGFSIVLSQGEMCGIQKCDYLCEKEPSSGEPARHYNWEEIGKRSLPESGEKAHPAGLA